MQSLFSRVKRQAGLVGDLKDFRDQNNAYLNFIQNLITAFTESREVYGNIKVTKRAAGITKVTIKDSSSGDQVEFIYRNRDLYIIGLVVGSTFYIDNEVYGELKNQIPSDWQTVINARNTVALSRPFSYGNILPSGANTNVEFGKLGNSLSQLTNIGDANKRIEIMSKHLGPFVVAFSEAIRFPVVAREVQGAIRSTSGKVSLSKNLVRQLSLGHPSERTDNHVFNIYSLLLNWSKLSERVPAFYGSNPPQHMPLVEGKYKINLEKNQLNALLGVANSQRFAKFTIVRDSRGKRDLTSVFDDAIYRNAPLLDQQVNYLDYEGNVQQAPPAPPLAMASIAQNLDVIGALHLLTVGTLYLYGKKMNVPLGDAQSYHDPKDALVVAVDITERVGCFLKSAGLELDVGYEEELALQRQLAKALVRGEGVQPVLTSFLQLHYSDLAVDEESWEALEKQLRRALATESGLAQGSGFDGEVCFQRM